MFRRRIVALSVSLALGIVVADIFINKGSPVKAFSVTALFLFSIYRIVCIRTAIEQGITRKYIRRDTILCALMFCVGCMNYAIHEHDMKPMMPNKLSNYNYIEGRVIGYKDNDKGLTIDVKTYSLGNETVVRCQKLKGFIRERGDGFKARTNAGYSNKKIKYKDMDHKLGTKLYGKLVKVQGIIKVPTVARNPGCFDYRRFLLTKKITYTMKVINISEIKGVKTSKLWIMRHSLNNTKEGFAINVSDGRNKAYGFIKGVTFGDTDDIDEDTIDEFRENTTAHVLAVSGLHVGVIYGMLRLMAMGRHGGIVGVLTMLAMLGYGELTTWNVSTTRAVILTCTAIMGFYLKRPFDLLSSLALSFIMLLIYNPFLLFSASFQMSFLAVCGIAFLTDPLGRLIGKRGGFLLAIQLSMIPYTVFTFNKINPIGFLINVPIVALIGMLVPFSIFGLATYSIIGKVGIIIKSQIFYLTEIIIRLNHLLNMGGKFSYSISSMKIATLIAIYALLFYICSEFNIVMLLRKRYFIVLQSVILILCMSITIGSAYRNLFLDYELVFIDVGQGDGIHIRTDNYDVLLDGGGERKRNIGEKVLKEYFLKNGCSNLDISIFTHMHMDHCKGAMELGEVYPVKQYMVPYPYRYQVKGRHVNLVRFRDKIRLEKGVWIEAIWPMDDRIATSESDDNELNTVYILHYKGVKIMLTGDLVEADELDMIEYYKSTDVLKCDILKVAHHGSRYSSNEKFIDAVNPRIAIIQVGEHNTYGHPNAGVIERFKKRGISVYRNDKEGAIGVDISNNKIRIDRMIKYVV